MRICALDPGLQRTGYAVLDSDGDRLQVVDAGTIRTDDGADLGKRLSQIYRDLCELLDETRPEVVAVENIYSHYRHPQTAVLMGHARGVILLAGAVRDIPVHQYAATQIKRMLTGKGRAGKSQMQQAIKVQLGLSRTPEPHDVADALAIGLCEAVTHKNKMTRLDASTAAGVSTS